MMTAIDLWRSLAVKQNIYERNVRGTCGATALVACTMASGLCNLAVAESSPPLFVPFDPLPGYQYCEPRAISGEGKTVVGGSGTVLYPRQAFIWTFESGTQGLGWAPGTDQSEAYAVSKDGMVIVGTSGHYEPKAIFHAFRWTHETGMQLLESWPGTIVAEARAVSADGTVIAGDCHSATEVMGFQWMDWSGMVPIGSLSPNPPDSSKVSGISSNGLIIVGQSDPFGDISRPVRWSSTSGMQHVILTTATMAYVYAASENGSVIVGGAGGDAVRKSGNTAQVLPNMTSASSVSADGTTVVGRHNITAPTMTVARIWTQPCGTRDLRDLLLSAGLSQVHDWQLNIPNDIADDNRTIVGMGTDPQGHEHGFLARLPKTGDVDFDGLVNVSDLLTTINAWGPCPASNCPFVDVNCDGVVNYTDLLSVIGHWDD